MSQTVISADIDKDTIVVAAGAQVSTVMKEERILFHLKSGKYYSLNKVGAFVWGLLEKPCTIGDICTKVTAQYRVEMADCEKDVKLLIARLLDAGFVETRSP